jgi:ADP-L-glycero-D-manno-heptose 6-epimerase
MIILTGGAGFVGSNILKRLNSDGHDDVLVVDNLKKSDKYRNLVGTRVLDIVDKIEFYDRLDKGAWDGESIEAILHQGACTDTLEYDGVYMMRTNYEASKSLLHFALRKNVPMVYASSAAVYGHTAEASEVPENESPLNIYGFSKLAFDNYVRRVAASGTNLVVGLRYFNVYGHGEQHKGGMASMVYQLSRQIQETGVARLFGALGPYGPGEQSRDFVSVLDLVEINMYFLSRDPVVAAVNAGSGVRSTWNDLANEVIKTLGRGRIEYFEFPERLRDKYQFNTRADLGRLRALGYDKPMTSLGKGIHDYVSTLDQEAARFLPQL